MIIAVTDMVALVAGAIAASALFIVVGAQATIDFTHDSGTKHRAQREQSWGLKVFFAALGIAGLVLVLTRPPSITWHLTPPKPTSSAATP